MHSVHVIVEGFVQGVGFRAFALREARALGLAGVVRNRADGTVEIEAEGDRVQLERLVNVLRRGPAGAHVSGAQVRWAEGGARHHGFVIAPTRNA
jgi:acylphosphatase